ncbi:MAG: hypothetical protein ABSE73_12795 [Planctomycetota bacterium]
MKGKTDRPEALGSFRITTPTQTSKTMADRLKQDNAKRTQSNITEREASRAAQGGKGRPIGVIGGQGTESKPPKA